MIIQDSREVNNKNGQLIQRRLGQPPLAFLEHGDYLLRGDSITAIVERVTNTGLLADIESGRAVEKLQGCAEDADIVLLLIEGLILPSRDGYTLVQEGGYKFDYYDLPPSWKAPEGANLKMSFRRFNWHFHSVAEFLTSVSLRWVHKVEFTLSPAETAERLKELDQYFTKNFDQHLLHLTHSRPFTMTRKDNLEEYILTSFPGIGHERARAIIDCFGLPLKWTVTEKQLSSVEGIGKITAKKLIAYLPKIQGHPPAREG